MISNFSYKTVDVKNRKHVFLRLENLNSNGSYKEKQNTKTLLFFHCLLGRPSFDLKFLSYLSRDYDVIAPHIPLKSTLNEMVDYTCDFSQDLHLKDYAVAGVSLGGFLTLHHAMKSNEVNSLYPINPIVPSNDGPVKMTANARYVIYNALFPWGKGDFPDMLKPKYAWQIFSDILENPLTLLNLVKDISKYSFPKNGEGSEKPGVMFCAKNDAFFSFDKNTRKKIRRRFPNLKTLTFGETHLSHQNYSRDLADKITAHYQSIYMENRPPLAKAS